MPSNSLIYMTSASHWLSSSPFEPAVTAADDAEPFVSPELGLLLSGVCGASYAVSAFFASYGSKAVREQWPGWTEASGMRWQGASAGFVVIGGVAVFLANSSGHPLALLNAIMNAVNLLGNMVFATFFGVSEYTKSMQSGTIVFAITAVLLSTLAPPPVAINPSDLLTLSGLAVQAIFWSVMLTAAIGLCKVYDRGIRDTGKLFAWATVVSGLSVVTDNWSRVMGVLEIGPSFYIAGALLFPVGIFSASCFVRAMSSCDIAIYVPTQLCLQLVANLVVGYVLWGDGAGMGNPVGYLAAYAICMFSVYIASPQLDLMATIHAAREMRGAGLSKGQSATNFGNSMLQLIASWNRLRLPGRNRQVEVVVEDARESLKQALNIGMQSGAIAQEDAIDLTSQLWMHAANTKAGARQILEWFDRSPFFQEYFANDPNFKDTLVGCVAFAEPRKSLAGQEDTMVMRVRTTLAVMNAGPYSMELRNTLEVD